MDPSRIKTGDCGPFIQEYLYTLIMINAPQVQQTEMILSAH